MGDRFKNPNKEYRDPRTWMVDGIPIPPMSMSEVGLSRPVVLEEIIFDSWRGQRPVEMSREIKTHGSPPIFFLSLPSCSLGLCGSRRPVVSDPTLPLSLTHRPQDEMAKKKIPRNFRDNCAHLLHPLNKCRQNSSLTLWSCKRLRHDYYMCQHKNVIRKVAIKNEMQKQGKLPPKKWENPSPEYVQEMRANAAKGYDRFYGAYTPKPSPQGVDVPHARAGEEPSAPSNRSAWKMLFFWGDYDGYNGGGSASGTPA